MRYGYVLGDEGALQGVVEQGEIKEQRWRRVGDGGGQRA